MREGPRPALEWPAWHPAARTPEDRPMTRPEDPSRPHSITRRTALRSSLAAVPAAALVAGGSPAPRAEPDPRRGSPRRYRDEEVDQPLGLPLPRADDPARVPAAGQGRRLRRHRAELRPRERPLAEGRPRASSRRSARWPTRSASPSAALCSFLYWPYSLTDNDPARRARGLELAALMIQAAHDLGTENLLVVAGSVYIPWLADREPVPDRRLRPPGPRGDRQAAARWPRSWASP